MGMGAIFVVPALLGLFIFIILVQYLEGAAKGQGVLGALLKLIGSLVRWPFQFLAARHGKRPVATSMEMSRDEPRSPLIAQEKINIPNERSPAPLKRSQRKGRNIPEDVSPRPLKRSQRRKAEKMKSQTFRNIFK